MDGMGSWWIYGWGWVGADIWAGWGGGVLLNLHLIFQQIWAEPGNLSLYNIYSLTKGVGMYDLDYYH